MIYIPNIITSFRIVGSIALLITEPFSKLFYIIYFLCGISDILDGYLSRKLKCTSKTGQILDSIADMLLVFVMLIIMIPLIHLPLFALLWIALIFIIRILSLCIGFIKFNSFSSLHTYANKFTGIVLFSFPFIYICFGLYITIFLTCTIASISALEELIINIKSKNLNRDIKSLLENKKN